MFPVLFIKFVAAELHGGGAEMGIIRGCAAFGGLAASALVLRFTKHVRPEALMMWGFLSFAVVAAVFINAPLIEASNLGYLLLFALSGLPNATSQIGTSATAQHLCPPQVLGRLSGIASASGAVGAAIGTIAAGLLVDHVRIIPLSTPRRSAISSAALPHTCSFIRRIASARESASVDGHVPRLVDVKGSPFQPPSAPSDAARRCAP